MRHTEPVLFRLTKALKVRSVNNYVLIYMANVCITKTNCVLRRSEQAQKDRFYQEEAWPKKELSLHMLYCWMGSLTMVGAKLTGRGSVIFGTLLDCKSIFSYNCLVQLLYFHEI